MSRVQLHIIGCLLLGLLLVSSCRKDKDNGDLTDIPYDVPEPYNLDIPEGFPDLVANSDNPLTEPGVQLGRRLFYDPILSADGTMSCSSCHKREKGFADDVPTSLGIDGIPGTRHAMSLLNVGFFENGLNWDGSIATLEEQAIEPVINPVELHDDWGNVEEKLRNHPDYPERFRAAFGISNKSEITKELATKAIAQFEKIIVSGGNSRFDRALRGEIFFTDSEFNGYDMFFDISPDFPDAECGHCHTGPLLTTNDYFNNGLDGVDDLNNFEDIGRGAVTDYIFDNGKFRAPSLRNIALTAPYMHDGRFQTLEEVLDHYDSGGHYAENLDPLILNLGLTEEQKQDIINLLHSFTDTTYLENPDLTNPF